MWQLSFSLRYRKNWMLRGVLIGLKCFGTKTSWFWMGVSCGSIRGLIDSSSMSSFSTFIRLCVAFWIRLWSCGYGFPQTYRLIMSPLCFDSTSVLLLMNLAFFWGGDCYSCEKRSFEELMSMFDKILLVGSLRSFWLIILFKFPTPWLLGIGCVKLLFEVLFWEPLGYESGAIELGRFLLSSKRRPAGLPLALSFRSQYSYLLLCWLRPCYSSKPSLSSIMSFSCIIIYLFC